MKEAWRPDPQFIEVDVSDLIINDLADLARWWQELMDLSVDYPEFVPIFKVKQ